MTFSTSQLATGTAIACLTLFSIVTGCKKNSSGPAATGVSATLSGAAWQSNVTSAAHSTLLVGTTITSLQIKGTDSSAIIVTVADAIRVGETTAITQANVFQYFPKYNNWNSSYGFNLPPVSGHGTITLTARDTIARTIAGTYAGVAYNSSGDSIIVSRGSFNASYIMTP